MDSIISFNSLATTIGLGLLIGAVRERAYRDGTHAPAGIRTHLMAALAGALGAAMGPTVLVTVIVLLGALAVASYLKTGDTDPGLTGEVALPVTALLAALAHSHPGLAAGIAVVVAAVLFAKRPLHQLVRERVSEQELQDGLLLAGAALVVLPLLPDTAVDPWGVLVPSRLWRMVVLILAVGMAGHIAMRVAGARWGLPVAGFLAGFASSTAAVIGFGQRAREEPAHVSPAAAGALFANLGSLGLFAAVIGAAAPALLAITALPLAGAAAGALGVALASSIRRESLDALPAGDKSRAFHLSHALLLVGVMGVLLVVSAVLQRHFGSTAAVLAAAAVAVVEVHAAAASLGQLAAQEQLALMPAAWGLALLVLVGSLTKSTLAFVSGGPKYGFQVSAGLMTMPLGMAAVLYFKSVV